MVCTPVGPEPLESHGTRVRVCLNEGYKRHNWSAGINHMNSEKFHLKVMTPANCIVGKYKLFIESKLQRAKGSRPGEGEEAATKGAGHVLYDDIYSYKTHEPMYIIFNPFNKG